MRLSLSLSCQSQEERSILRNHQAYSCNRVLRDQQWAFEGGCSKIWADPCLVIANLFKKSIKRRSDSQETPLSSRESQNDGIDVVKEITG